MKPLRHSVIPLVLIWSCCPVVECPGAAVILSAGRGAGVSGTVSNDVDFFVDSDGSFSTARLGSFSFAGGMHIAETPGSVDGFARHNSSISPSEISMSGTADANVSSGSGEFDYASGGGHSSIDVYFRLLNPAELHIVYSGGGYPAYVEPYLQLFGPGASLLVNYGSGSADETILVGPGYYSLSGGISAGASANSGSPSGSALGGIAFTVSIVPEVPSSAMIFLAMSVVATCSFAPWRRSRCELGTSPARSADN
jgi:hypothetical protein